MIGLEYKVYKNFDSKAVVMKERTNYIFTYFGQPQIRQILFVALEKNTRR